MNPIATEISHCFQLSILVVVNFTRNSTMTTYSNTYCLCSLVYPIGCHSYNYTLIKIEGDKVYFII